MSSGFARNIYGFESVEFIFGSMLVFAAIMLAVLTASLVAITIREGRTITIRLKWTRKEPVLTLRAGQRYHLFNSHIWSTGQDATATIKRQLQRLVPGCRIL